VLVPADEKPKPICTGNESLKLLCFFLVPDIRPGTQEFPPATPT
jgi:hypothetical protein